MKTFITVVILAILVIVGLKMMKHYSVDDAAQRSLQVSQILVSEFDGFAGIRVEDNPNKGTPTLVDGYDKATLGSEILQWDDPRYSQARQEFANDKAAIREGKEKIEMFALEVKNPHLSPKNKSQIQVQLVHIIASMKRMLDTRQMTSVMIAAVQKEIDELKEINTLLNKKKPHQKPTPKKKKGSR